MEKVFCVQKLGHERGLRTEVSTPYWEYYFPSFVHIFFKSCPQRSLCLQFEHCHQTWTDISYSPIEYICLTFALDL